MLHAPRHTLLIAALLWAFQSLGCGSTAPAQTCESHDNCPAGEFCEDGACTPDLSCEEDADCGEDGVCEDGSCTARCRGDGDCAGLCGDDGRCMAAPGCTSDDDCVDGAPHCDTDAEACVSCLSDAHCEDGEACQAGACVGIGSCEDHAGCPPEHLCDGGTCVPGCEDDDGCLGSRVCDDAGQCATGGCTGDEDCEDGVCETGTGRCIGCHDATDCAGAEEICLDGNCMPEGEECDPNTLCELGNVCVDGYCVSGCNTIQDCPGDLRCDPDAGARGACVECVDETHCSEEQSCRDGVCIECEDDEVCEEGEICEGSKCVAGCRDDAGCAANEICAAGSCREGCRDDDACGVDEVCDTEENRCVAGCQNDDGCPLGSICDEDRCVDGCRLGRDCPVGTYCDTSDEPGTCVEGCLGDSNCESGYCHTDSNTCVTCLSDEHCPGVCDTSTFTCTTSCNNNNQCFGARNYCEGGICVECGSDAHCSGGAVCHPDTHVCVGCVDGDDCDGDDLCDPAALVCVACLSDGDCDEGVCDTGAGACVECVADSDCADGGTCDPLQNVCLGTEGRPLCAVCTDDAQCGGADDLCVSFVASDGTVIDQGCGTACVSGADCPRGYDCVELGSGRGHQCVPSYNHPVRTCAAHRTLDSSCNRDPIWVDDWESCGVAVENVDDADCQNRGSFLNPDWYCSFRCTSVEQCPATHRCVTDLDGQGRCRP